MTRLILLVALQLAAAIATAAPAPEPLFIGGVGGVYFLADPGELVVEIEKRDRNRRASRTDLRAILAGPDRQVLQEATIPDDGQPRGSGLGPVQKCRLSARVPVRGVYALNITVSQDRYGEEIVWSFKSNCRKYIIETSRGHKDERHQEAIVLASPDQPGDVCFMPRRGAMAIEISGLKPGSGPVKLSDVRGQELAMLAVDSTGHSSHAVPASVSRQAVPWRLHFPVAEATINVDGLTRWDPQDIHQDAACWTPDPDSWFPFLDNRWILSPYSRKVYGAPGERKQVLLQVHNNSAAPKTVQLALDAPAAAGTLSTNRVILGPKQTRTVTLQCAIPSAGPASFRITAAPAGDPAFSTYSTITLQPGPSPASRPVQVPIQLSAYAHENEQFGYWPDYPAESQMYFDLRNRPFIRTSQGVAVLRGDQWSTSQLSSAVTARPPQFQGNAFAAASTKLAFDRDNHLYALSTAGRTALLLHSTNSADTFAAYVIPGREDRPRSFDIETFSGQNTRGDPPPILRYTQTSRDPKLIWRRVNDLELFLPGRTNGTISLGQPVLLSTNCIGSSAHSGIPAAVVSRGSKVHIVWGEATDPSQKAPGVPTFVASYDQATGQLGKPALVAYGPPANDVHNSPGITMDGEGYLHVLAGTHGRPFPYARSLQPNDAQSGWTPPVLAGEGLGQTYIGLVTGPDGTLHAVFRMWRSGVEPFPASSHATLAYQRKRPGQAWEAPCVLVVAPFSEYSIFYHRVTIDREGRLLISYDYWSTFWFYRNDQFERRRTILTSPDSGETWKLLEATDLKP